ncbi:uncharacterized protein [Montipora foliosa]|uniref:uncharacterized protein n=1 Tax=Montipora foliosa TaxID=591990 RepID=UPI0035F0FDA5
MDLAEDKAEEDLKTLSFNIPVLSEYAKALDKQVKRRYLEKISVVGVDPVSIPSEQFDPECLPQIESTDLLGYLVLETSFYTRQQFKAYKSLEAFNQMVSGFVSSVRGCMISNKHVVVAKVRHSQRMNDPLVNIWIIADSDGTILSTHCLGCKAGLAESCSHIASVLFYIEAWIRINGKLACTQVKCTWLLPTFVNEVPYARVRNIDFSSAKKLKENLDAKIDCLSEGQAETGRPNVLSPSQAEMTSLFDKLNNCKLKPVTLSLTAKYADHFIAKSRTVPVVSDLFETENLDLDYHELLQKCAEFKLDISRENIELVEKDTRAQAKSSGFFRHRAGRIGASVSGAAFRSNLSQPPQALIKSICYPNVFKVNTKATRHGCKHEDDAIRAYENEMKKTHCNFTVTRCGLFINKKHPFLHATPDFLTSCDCCGLGCGEVKCPICIKDCDFEKYTSEKNACLEKVDGVFCLKRHHDYYFQVQQQLFTLPDRKHCDFVVCAISPDREPQIVKERIYPDFKHWDTVVPKLEAFWRVCILPEILGRWYTRKCTLPINKPNDNGVCFCQAPRDETVITCINPECAYGEFHPSCLAFGSTMRPKTWYCPHCSRLPQFIQRRGHSSSAKQSAQVALNQAALQCNSICVCASKASPTDRLIECHSPECSNGKFFYLACLGFKRMPNNSKTTWQCSACKKRKQQTKATTCTSYVSAPTKSTSDYSVIDGDNDDDCHNDDDDDDGADDDISITQVTVGVVDKQSALAKLDESDYLTILSPTSWLTGDIIHQAQVLLQKENSAIEGFQRPTLGPVRNFNVVSGEFVQILHTGSNHWVCVSSIGCLPGHVNLYDSLYHDAISQEVEDQTNDLLGGRLASLQSVSVQQQTNGSDCGVFAIAIATCLALGTDPSHVTFDIQGMRSHLVACFKAEKMSMFPCF